MKDSLSVNEFSKLSGIERTTLRYWDEIGLFSPARRDPDNNYRYYSPYQIISVNFVSVLSDFNIPLKTIATERDKRTPESIVSLIERQGDKIICGTSSATCHTEVQKTRKLRVISLSVRQAIQRMCLKSTSSTIMDYTMCHAIRPYAHCLTIFNQINVQRVQTCLWRIFYCAD